MGLGVGGYLGGHLSYAQGVGVNRNADEAPKPREWTDGDVAFITTLATHAGIALTNAELFEETVASKATRPMVRILRRG